MGSVLGRSIASLINLFNPELVVLGGKVARGNDYLMMSINSTVKRFALNYVAKDTRIVFSKLGRKAAPIGAAMLSRAKILGL